MNDDFERALEASKGRVKAQMRLAQPIEEEEPPAVELSSAQKKLVIEYMLGSVGKGMFEDVTEFWSGMKQEEIDHLYPSYKDAVERFVQELKHHLLVTIGEA
jgi:hypothetical protein